jgi:hypothetical protein
VTNVWLSPDLQITANVSGGHLNPAVRVQSDACTCAFMYNLQTEHAHVMLTYLYGWPQVTFATMITVRQQSLCTRWLCYLTWKGRLERVSVT